MGALRTACLRGASESGTVVALVALTMPVLVLFAALVIDVGNWKEKDRNLQTRADAAALAAGVEYVRQLRACVDPDTQGSTGTAIANVAKQYAGKTGATAAQNQGINEQTRVWVGVNTTTYGGGADFDDGGSPCADHAPDAISPGGGLWTDVKLTEANIPSFFGSLGMPLDQVNARARVEMKQIAGVAERSLPFVSETGDQVECVWAEFVGGASGVENDGFTVSPSNPVPLTGGPYSWSATGVTLTLGSSVATAPSDVAVRYWLGSKDGSAPCDWSSPNKSPLPQDFDGGQPTDPVLPVSIDWINVWDNGANPGADQAPKLRRFALTSNSCGGPGYLYTTDPSPSATCRVGWVADVDTGPNTANGSITVRVANDPDDDPSTAAPASVTASWPAGSGVRTIVGSTAIRPNAVSGATSVSEDYTQVGQIFFAVDWEQTSGKVGGKTCRTNGNPRECSGTFPGETVADQWGARGSSVPDVQQMTYMADPLASTPLVAAELGFESSLRGAPDTRVTFDVHLTHTALDQEHVVVFHDSVQASGNRTRAIWCGNGNQGAAALEDATANGCAKRLVLNTREDACGPPYPTIADDPWDCVEIEQGNTTGPMAQGFTTRFQCTTNGWAAARAAGTYPPEGDARWAYIVLTGYGRTFAAPNNGWVPIEGLLRVYVVGWDVQGGGPVRPSSCAGNDPPPRGYDTRGAQIWGHIVDPVVLDPGVIAGVNACDRTLLNLQCKPALVR